MFQLFCILPVRINAFSFSGFSLLKLFSHLAGAPSFFFCFFYRLLRNFNDAAASKTLLVSDSETSLSEL